MSHRKYEAPRHGSLGFLPRKRCRRGQGRVRAFPRDDKSQKPHFTAFMAYKAGMTHVVRDIERPGSKLNKREVVESVTILDAPAMVVVGCVGYIETPQGLKALSAVWAAHLSEDMRRKFYKRWYCSKKKAFTKYASRMSDPSAMDAELNRLKEKCCIIRAICHTQPAKTPLKQKRAHVMEIQINGGQVSEKVDFVRGLFEQSVSVSSVFGSNECVDTIAITKGRGVQGVVKRWGVTKLPRKTHRGIRKVACIGAWHPARVSFHVARHGQDGFHHRTELNKRIYRIGAGTDPRSAATDSDITEKAITPMGGFPHYGTIRNDFVMLRGTVQGPKKRVITLRKSLFPPTSRKAQEEVVIKFIDTSSKMGHGRFQTSTEKRNFMGPTKQKKLIA